LKQSQKRTKRAALVEQLLVFEDVPGFLPGTDQE
jgi:acetyl-CoA carboxylase carboxyltransferase component